jgi:dTDP-glucose pyrophosphorylase
MKGGSITSGEVQKEEDRLQAIVLAGKRVGSGRRGFPRDCLLTSTPYHRTDSFTGSFRPCSLDKPKVLLPLLNMPMLDYVMEFLVAAGVQV